MKHSRIRRTVAALIVAATATTTASAATIYTDRAAFVAATTGQTTTDFNNLGNSASFFAQTYAGTGFTIANDGSFFRNCDAVNSSERTCQFNSGDVLRFGGSLASVTAAAGVTALGFDFSYGLDTALTGTPITINNVDYAVIGQPVFNFFGIVDTAGVGPISINFNGGRGFIDNVRVASAAAVVVDTPPVAVPEPATWGTMLLGLVMTGAVIRRRRPQTRVRFA